MDVAGGIIPCCNFFIINMATFSASPLIAKPLLPGLPGIFGWWISILFLTSISYPKVLASDGMIRNVVSPGGLWKFRQFEEGVA